jgi:hypothetical protein
MSHTGRRQFLELLRRCLRFLKERLKDVTQDPMLTTKQRREKEVYSTRESPKPEHSRWRWKGTERA